MDSTRSNGEHAQRFQFQSPASLVHGVSPGDQPLTKEPEDSAEFEILSPAVKFPENTIKANHCVNAVPRKEFD